METSKRRTTDNKYEIETRDQICPLLAGLNRMGCRGLHCQWWVPSEDQKTGDCAMVYLAIGSGVAGGRSVAEVLAAKQSIAEAWHGEVPTRRQATSSGEKTVMAKVLSNHRSSDKPT